jgi:hypothetical protein
VRVENFPVADAAELDALVARFLADGYEGAIARKDGAGYRYGYNGYHSANLLKIKPTFDAEFPVVGFTQGSRGKEVGAVIWECEVPGGPGDPGDRRFTVVPKDMSYEERRALFQCLGGLVPGPGGPGAAAVTRFERDLRGRPLTVEYREVSAKTGKPLQAKALALMAERIDARRALAIGLVHQVVPAHDLDAAVDAALEALRKGSPQAQRAIKSFFGQLSVGPVGEDARELSAQTISQSRSTDDAREGFAAFLEKRPPRWEGR